MSCLRIEEIYAYLESELLPAHQAEVENHLAACPKCRQAVLERRLVEEAASRLPELELPTDFSRRVMARILRQESSLPAWLAVLLIGLSSVGLLYLLLLLSGGKTAFALIAGFHRFFLAYFKNTAVLLAKLMILLSSTGRVLRVMFGALAKYLSLLATLVSPEVQALMVTFIVAFFVSLYFGLKKKLLSGEKT